ncbi:MAG TPA: F0F1 ATP synthase subunit B [Longimicrobiaceae bacterium]|nr:F0F1 ATP synthase subunit B [Longimicrobiaceae bacterium]
MRRLLFVLTALVLGSAAPLHAAEGGLLEANTGLMVWTIVIFGIVLLILSRAAYPKILGAVEARERHLAELAAAAERDRAEAATLLEDARLQRETARAEIQAAMAESRTEVERMKADILAEARRDQEELMERARRDIAAEREATIDAVRRDAVELAMRAAEKLVRRNLDAEENRRLVREYLGQLSGPAVPAGV